jgi:hypothetical protein
MKRITINDNFIKEVGFDIQTNTLEVKFYTSEVFQLFNVPPKFFIGLLMAESIAQYYDSAIRNCFQCRLIGIDNDIQTDSSSQQTFCQDSYTTNMDEESDEVEDEEDDFDYDSYDLHDNYDGTFTMLGGGQLDYGEAEEYRRQSDLEDGIISDDDS